MNSEELQLLPVTGAGGTLSIAYRFREPEGGKPAFVWFCGYRSEMASLKADELARWTGEAGAGCLRFDYSGHGRSGGRFEDGTIGAWLDEAAAVCAAALSPDAPAVFVGSSMGGWIALLLARRLAAQGLPGPKGIVLIAPAWDMTRLMRGRLTDEARAALERDGVFHHASRYSDRPTPIAKALLDEGDRHLLGGAPIAVDAPVRILHGVLDPDVPWRHSLDLMEALAAGDVRVTLVKDAGHRLSRPQDLALLRATLAEFV
ncbi:MAG: alpha/beta fold hydrolase [Rhodomicrobium sp.]